MSAVGFSISYDAVYDFFQQHYPKLVQGIDEESKSKVIYCPVWYQDGCLEHAGRHNDCFKSSDFMKEWYATRQAEYSEDSTKFTAIVKTIYHSEKKNWVALSVTVSSFCGMLCFLRNDNGLSTFAIKTTIFSNKNSGHTTIQLKDPLRVEGCIPYYYNFKTESMTP
jgi:hypothetical protein